MRRPVSPRSSPTCASSPPPPRPSWRRPWGEAGVRRAYRRRRPQPDPRGGTVTTSTAASAVLAGLDGMRAEQEDFYRTLHQHPELSHQEHRTAAAVAERLQQAGFEVHTKVGGTGVVGVLDNGVGPAVLLR